MYYDKCVKRLETFGFLLGDTAEKSIIENAVERAVNYIKNFCNIRKIPRALECEVVDYACGISLEILKNSGLLKSSELNFDRSANKITEGDVCVNFESGSSDSDKADRIIAYLKDIDGILTMYRKIVW
jgi:hypothetical protein